MSRALWMRCDGEWFSTIPRAGFPGTTPSVRLPDWGDTPPAAPPRVAAPEPENEPGASPARRSEAEIREHPRRPLVQQVDYTIGDRFYQDAMRDISVGGMFIETNLMLDIGQEVTVSIPFSDGRPPVRVRGEVVRVVKDGIGIRFRRDRKTLRG